MTFKQPCRDCGAFVAPEALVDGLCEDCDDKAYEHNVERWRVTDD